MGLLDSITKKVTGLVSTATHAVEDVEEKVEHTASALAHGADEFAGVIKDKTAELLKPTPAADRTMFSGVTDAFKHAGTMIEGTVESTVKSVEGSIENAASGLSKAGHAVEQAGQQVVSSGQQILSAGEHAWNDLTHLVKDAGHLVRDAGQVVVGAGKAAFHAGDAVLTGDPSQLDAARRSIEQAHAALTDAHASLTDAHAQVTDLGAQGQAVASAIGAAKQSVLDARDAVTAAGQAVKSAIDSVVGAPRALVTGVGDALATGGAEARTAFANDVPGGKQMLAGLDVYAAGAKKTLDGVLHLDPGTVAHGVIDEAKGLVGFGKGLYQSPLGQYAKHAIVDYANGFNVGKQIRELKAGETYSIKVGGDVHAGFGGEAKGTLSVKKNDDGTYTMNALGAAGVNGYLSPEQVGKEGATASARLLLGGNGEFKFDSAADAERAAKIFEKTAALAASPAASMLVGQPTAEDVAFLGQHCTAVELSGKLAGDAGLGLEIPGLKERLGASLGANLSATQSVRVELKNGQPVGLVVKNELGGNLNGGVGLRTPAPPPKEGEQAQAAKIRLAIQGSVTTNASIETHFALPANLKLDSVLADPGALVKSLGQPDSMTVHTTVQGDGALGLPGTKLVKGNLVGELTITGKPSEVLDASVIAKAMGGDLEGAARDASKRVTITGNVHTQDKKTWGVEDFALTIADVGLKGTFEAEKSHQNPNELEFSYRDGKASVAMSPEAQRLAEAAKKLALATRGQLRG